MSDEVHYRLLKLLEERPQASQRQLAEALGVSLGKANYCVKALLEKGWLKAKNFKNSQNKLAYAYLVTPSGIDAKAKITARFLKRKLLEYEALKEEIEQLTAEVNRTTGNGSLQPFAIPTTACEASAAVCGFDHRRQVGEKT